MAPRPIDVVIRGQNESRSAFLDVTKSAEQLKEKIEGLNKPFEALKNVVSSVGAFMVVEFFKKTIEASMEAEAAWARIGAAVENAGIHFGGVRDELEKTLHSMTKTSRFSDEQLSNAFATLLNVTNDYKGSLANLGLVTNIAIARHMDLEQAATLVGRVMDGNTSMLKRYGIVLKENGIDPMEQLKARFHDFAERDANTFGGSLHRLANSWKELEEAIGRAITGGTPGTGLNGAIEKLTKIASFIDEHPGLFHIETWFQRGAGGPNFGAAMMQGGQELLAEKEKETNAREAAAERERQRLIKETEELRKETEGGYPESPDVLRALALWKKQGFDPGSNPLLVRNSLLEMRQRGELNRASMAFLNAGGPQAADLTTNPFSSNRPAQTMAEATKTVTGFGRGLRESFGDGSQYLSDFDERLGKMAGESIPALARGFEQMFEAIGKGENVFKAVGKGIASMVAEVAAKMGAEEFAQGLAMLARSIWDFLGPNPAAGASATQHFAAAAAFGGLAGGASAFGGRVGGGGGGSGNALGAGSFLNQQSSIAGRSRTTVVFKGRKQIYDMTDPEDRAQLVAAIKAIAGDGDIDFVFDAA